VIAPTPEEVGRTLAGASSLVTDVSANEDATLLTTREARQRLAIGKTKFFELLSSGEIESILIGRARRIPARAVVEYVQRKQSGCDSAPPAVAPGWDRAHSIGPAGSRERAGP
jgi:excisionase family DNA binding protein